jgi:hypothetical protein
MAIMQPKTPVTYDVEILTNEGLWAKHCATASVPVKTRKKIQINFRWRHWAIRVAAALLSIGLHVLLVGASLLGTSGRPPTAPHIEGMAAASQNESATESVSVLLLVDRSITPPEDSFSDQGLASPELSEKLLLEASLVAAFPTPKMPEINTGDGGMDEESPTAEATGDEAGRAMLFGRYMGQLKARIERAWEHPVASSVRQFECVAQIKQTANGEVQEVTLQRCGDDPIWQMSLVQAIQRASPLSAPPNENVFSAVVTLSFTGYLAAMK